MDIESIAREIRARIMDRIEADRCVHASSIEDEVAHVLRMHAAMPTMPAVGHDRPPYYKIMSAPSSPCYTHTVFGTKFTWIVR